MPRIAIFLIAAISLATTATAQDKQNDQQFAGCEDAASHPLLTATECVSIGAPLDHAAPDAGVLEIFVRKFPADGEARGQLWLVAGGPGESGASFYPFIDTLKAAAPGFDLLVPDHRGTGFSTRLCPEEEGQGSEAGGALSGEEWGTCFGALNASSDRTRAFTITNAARDLQLLMSRLGDGGPTYVYGVSYGTQLVVRLLALGAQPDIDGIILDSLVPLETDSKLDLSHRSAVTDHVGREVLRECDMRAECRRYFPEGSERALEQLVMREDISGLAGGNLKYRLGALLDFPETRAMIPEVIAGLQAGDPAWLQFATEAFERLGSVGEPLPQSAASIPLVSLISRSENNARPGLTREMIASEAEQFLFASPLPSLLLAGGVPTYQRDANFGVLPTVIPPTIVLHGALDPKTSFEGAEAHVAKLERAGTIDLVRIDRAPHFILMTAPDAFTPALQAFLAQR